MHRQEGWRLLHSQRQQIVSEAFRTVADVRWISNSGEADTFLIFANVDPSKGYKGITCFVMSKDEGVQIAKRESKVGL